MYSVDLNPMFYSSGRNHSAHVHRPAALAHQTLRVRAVPSHEEIASLAYSYWIAGGRREGTQLEDWLRAERILRQR